MPQLTPDDVQQALDDTPLVTENAIYQYSSQDGLVAVETALDYLIKKRMRWSLANGRQALTTYDRFAYIRGTSDELLVVKQADGARQVKATILQPQVRADQGAD